MRVEILTVEDCPNAGIARERTQEAIRREGLDVPIAFIGVDTLHEAQRMRFLGSPSVRIDGEDVDLSAREQRTYGVTCRTEIPTTEVIQTAIRAAKHHSRDALDNPWILGAAYGLPVLALLASGFLGLDQVWRGGLWAGALAIMGTTCLTNALRCGRVHCYFTGPFFLAMAVVALLYGFGLAPLGVAPAGWNIISAVVLVGFLALYYLPERVLQKRFY